MRGSRLGAAGWRPGNGARHNGERPGDHRPGRTRLKDTHDSAHCPLPGRSSRWPPSRCSSRPRAQVAAPARPAGRGAGHRPRRSTPRCRSSRRSAPGRLPNGLRYFVRQNGRPAKRVSLRLAVDVGSIQEEDDQRGLAHFLEHMAFNGSTHFKPGELVAFLESIGARFGPHVNASTSFDETIYMLDVPTDREGYVDKAPAGAARLRRRGVADDRGNRQGTRRRARGMARPPRRQLAHHRPAAARALLRVALRRPAADRPARDAEVRSRRERLRDFYRTWYRADRMAVVVAGDVAARRGRAAGARALRRPADAVRRRRRR